MNFYPFHIGDYHAHTAHLDLLEDLAYRRMLDYCFLHESGLPESVEEIARLIRMRTHCECIANALLEFFTQHSDGTWHNHRVDEEVAKYREKSDKAAKSARKRWKNTDANAMRTHSERNANQNQEPITKTITKDNTAQAPTAGKPASRKTKLPADFVMTDDRLNAAERFWKTKNRTDLIARDEFMAFRDHHTAHGKAMADWDAAWRTWYTNAVKFSKPTKQSDGRTYAEKLMSEMTDQSWADRLPASGESAA